MIDLSKLQNDWTVRWRRNHNELERLAVTAIEMRNLAHTLKANGGDELGSHVDNLAQEILEATTEVGMSSVFFNNTTRTLVEEVCERRRK